MNAAPKPHFWRELWLPLAIISPALSLNAIWIARRTAPLDWDTSWYLENAIQFSRALTEHGVGAFFAAVRQSFGFKAPGAPMLAAPVLALFGEQTSVALCFTLLIWAVGLLYLFALSRLWFGVRESLVTVALMATMPLSFSLARTFFVETALTTAVIAFVFHAAASRHLTRPVHLVAIALWCALGLLIKVSFPAYIVAPALVATFDPKQRSALAIGRWLFRWALVSATGAGLAAWVWYGANWKGVIGFAGSASFGAISTHYGASFAKYLRALIFCGISAWYVLVGTALIAWHLSRREWREVSRRAAFILAWLFPPMVVMLAAPNKDLRYLDAILPAVALGIASLLEANLETAARRAQAFAIGILLAPALGYLVYTSVASKPWAVLEQLSGQIPWHQLPPAQESWRHEELIADLIKFRSDETQTARVALNIEVPWLNLNNLDLAAVRAHQPILFYQLDQATLAAAKLSARRSRFLFSWIDGPLPDDFLNVQTKVVAQLVRERRLPFEQLKSYRLPDGTEIGLFQASCPQPPNPSSDGTVVARFKNGAELLQARAVRGLQGEVEVQTFWRQSGESESRKLTIFTHVFDGPILNLDAPPCVPTSSWRPDVTVEHSVSFVASEKREKLLRFGLFDPVTLERVPIVETRDASFQLEENNTQLAWKIAF